MNWPIALTAIVAAMLGAAAWRHYRDGQRGYVLGAAVVIGIALLIGGLCYLRG